MELDYSLSLVINVEADNQKRVIEHQISFADRLIKLLSYDQRKISLFLPWPFSNLTNVTIGKFLKLLNAISYWSSTHWLPFQCSQTALLDFDSCGAQEIFVE